jgi:hypothetical protein
MNPRSGGGKVARFQLQQRAEALGAEVALLYKPHTDVQQLARDALAAGADLLGVAAGTAPRHSWPRSRLTTTCRSW